MRYLLLFFLLVFLSGCSSTLEKELVIGEVAILPKPLQQTTEEGYFEIHAKTKVSVENEAQLEMATRFFQQFETVTAWIPNIGIADDGDIVFSTQSDLSSEAYVLEVQANRIEIKAASEAGFFYALQSLKQLLPTAFYGNELQVDKRWGIPVTRIEDAPAFAWRGFMLDVSRHFFTVDQVKEVLDIVAAQKLNRFHWHLTDDQGWRIEIKSYPKLTEIGAWRVDHNNTDENISDWWGRPVQKEGEKATYGGFYTQEELKEIIAYAKERHIEVIPEIDMPGHAQAAVASYPEIGAANAAKYVATGGAYQNNTLNPGKEETYIFAEKVLNEVMDLFPFEYVHIGGDECNKSQWKVDKDAQQKMRAEGLKNEEELQSYFIERLEKIINQRNKIMIGWDEILEGGLAPNATVMSWRGEEGGLKSVKMGHEVIMTPSNYCYIDLKQGHDDLEPNLGYSRLLLSKAYSYQVIPNELSEEQGKLIKGVQANLWTESISDWSKLTYMTFPRLYAIAETAWTPYEQKDWEDFTDRLQVEMERLDAQGIRYAVSAFRPWIHHEGKEKGIEIRLTTEVANLEIRYTLDGSGPDSTSTKYETPFLIESTSIIKAQSFQDGKAIGTLATLDLPVHSAQQAKVRGTKSTKKQSLNRLTDLSYARLHPSDTNWVAFPNKVDLELRLEEPSMVKSIQFNSLRYTISGIYPPEKVEIWGKKNSGQQYELLAEIEQTEKAHQQGRNKVLTQLNFDPTKVTHLKIKASSLSPLTEGHHRAGRKSAMRIDEIVVN